MKTTAVRLLPNQQLYSDTGSNLLHIPSNLTEVLDSLDYSAILTNGSSNSSDIQQFLAAWVNEVVVIFNTFFLHELEAQQLNIEKLIHIADTFTQQLLDFVSHTDHGIMHSLCVYHGMKFIADKENMQLSDSKMQLLALLHDCIQTIRIPSLGEIKIRAINQRNEHAEIIATVFAQIGQFLGFQSEEVEELALALKYHDSTYNGEIITDSKYTMLAKVLHDADKILSATTTPDPRLLLSTSLKRNLLANNGEVGSYLFRDLDEEYRSKWHYGDRCYCDSITVVRAEIHLHFYTQTAREISQQRKVYLNEEIEHIYGSLFDETFNLLQSVLQPIPTCTLFCVGMDQTPEEITTPLTNSIQLQMLILNLYERVLQLQSINDSERYNIDSDARGWKLKVVLPDTECILDPSVARFCFTQNGKLTTEKRTQFLENIRNVLLN